MYRRGPNIYHRHRNRFFNFERRFIPRRDLYDSEFAVTNLRPTSRLVGHEGCVNAISYHPLSSMQHLLVTGSDDTTVRIWDVCTQRQLVKFAGHASNVFATRFFLTSNSIVSAGNDGDIRLYDVRTSTCRVFQHHSRKILNLVLRERVRPFVFLSCSSDGTIRRYDTRLKYSKSSVEPLRTNIVFDGESEESIIPQAMGGGRIRRRSPGPGSADISSPAGMRSSQHDREGLLVDYGSEYDGSLYSLDWSSDGRYFVVGTGDGCARMFDMRMIGGRFAKDPDRYKVNIFRNVCGGQKSKGEVTGVSFSYDASEVAISVLGDALYTFDVTENYESEAGVDYKKVYRIGGPGGPRPGGGGGGDGDLSREQMDVDSVQMDDADDWSPFQRVGFLEPSTPSPRPAEDEEVESEGESSPYEDAPLARDHEDDSDDDDARNPFFSLLSHLAMLVGDDDDSDDDDIVFVGDPEEPPSSAGRGRGRGRPSEPPPVCPVPKTYRRRFTGHVSERTIKDCFYYGPTSRFLISGSDCRNIFVWDTLTSRLIRVLRGHEGIPNTIEPHPFRPFLASSGIDSYVQLWEPAPPYPSLDEIAARRETNDATMTENAKPRPTGISMGELFQLLMLQQQFGGGGGGGRGGM